jgi:hypothetical protein
MPSKKSLSRACANPLREPGFCSLRARIRGAAGKASYLVLITTFPIAVPLSTISCAAATSSSA